MRASSKVYRSAAGTAGSTSARRVFVQTLDEGLLGQRRAICWPARSSRPARVSPAGNGDRRRTEVELTPDGRAVVFAATVNRNAADAAFTDSQLLVPTYGASRSAHRATIAGRRRASRPTAARCSRCSNTQATRSLTRASGALAWPRRLRARRHRHGGLRSLGGDLVVHPDSRDVIAPRKTGAREAVSRASGRRSADGVGVEAGSYHGSGGSGASSRPALYANWESADRPAKSRSSTPRPASRALTRFNRRARRAARPAGQEFWFRAAVASASTVSWRGLRDSIPEEVPAVRGHPRRPAQHVARPVRHPLELPPARRAGLRPPADELLGFDRLRRRLRAAIQGDPLKGPATRSTKPQTRRFEVPLHRRVGNAAAAPAMAATSRTGCRVRLRATRPREPCRSLQPRVAVGDERRGLRSRGQYRRAALGRRTLWREQSPIRTPRSSGRRCSSPLARRLSRAAEQFLRVLDGVAAQNVPSRLIVFPEANHWIRRAKTAGSSIRRYPRGSSDG